MSQSRGAVRAKRVEDPQLRRMLVTHIHCGEEMQLVGAGQTYSPDVERKDDAGLLTYRCACGFCFDQGRD